MFMRTSASTHRSLAGTSAFKRSAREWCKVEMLFAYLNGNLGLRRLPLHGLTAAEAGVERG